jgi:uncharacterized membrane protein YecN with MAPEG domain
MAMQITAFYAALLAVLFIVLSFRVIGWRRERRVELGHGEDAELLRRMRVHANFAEYAPFTLLLMALAESMAPPHFVVHLAGLLLLAGRVLHAWGVSQSPPFMRYRILGMQLTFAALGLAALTCLALSTLFLAV